ncbi:MAG: addiction module toxin, HicA family [Chitinivibrionales bacterium]|nr:addiction module toxin, HicA family [Chitinivibrionales bacterium]
MKLPRDKSGRDLAHSLSKYWSYRFVHQTGSHMILETEDPTHQRIAIPDHTTIRIGTLNSIIRSVALHKNVSKDAIINTL